MARGKTWIIQGSVFSRKELAEQVKRIKDRLSYEVRITYGDADFEFMLELYKKHYPRAYTREIKTSEIMDLTVKMNDRSAWKSSSPTFFWIDKSNFYDNWNPKECWEPVPGNAQNAKLAFRQAIQPQMTEKWKAVCESIRDTLPACPITGKEFDPRVRRQSEVHHVDPQFKDILAAFLEFTGTDLDTVSVERVPNNGWKIADKNLEWMFVEFHKMHAKRIEVVSKEGHDIVTYKRKDSA